MSAQKSKNILIPPLKSDLTKEKIIEKTIELLKLHNGDAGLVTLRSIADRAGVGLGLINHYFGSKEQLIDICVRQIISGVVHSFRAEADCTSPLELTKGTARQVMDYLMENSQISRLSIQSDLSAPQCHDNSMNTAYGFAYCMAGNKQPDTALIQKGFYLVCILQESFLRKEVLKEDIGIDFQDKAVRDSYIDSLVEMIMEVKK